MARIKNFNMTAAECMMKKQDLDRRVSTGITDKVCSLLEASGQTLFDSRELATWLVDQRRKVQPDDPRIQIMG